MYMQTHPHKHKSKAKKEDMPSKPAERCHKAIESNENKSSYSRTSITCRRIVQREVNEFKVPQHC